MNLWHKILDFFSNFKQITDMMFSDGDIFEYIGYGAGIATAAAFSIQAVRILRAKNVRGLSSYMYTMYSLSLICWFAYGIYIDSWTLAISNLCTFFFTFIILLLILYYDEEDKIERYRRDPLTWLYNKKYYSEELPQRINNAITHKHPYAIIAAKINNLDAIHKQMGGKYSNRALKYASRTLEKALRDSDFIARIDTNLFAIYLDNAETKVVKSVVERVSDSLNSIEIKKNAKLNQNIQMVFGICPSTEEGDLKTLTQKAEKALADISPKSRSLIKIYQSEKKEKEKEKTKTKTKKTTKTK